MAGAGFGLLGFLSGTSLAQSDEPGACGALVQEAEVAATIAGSFVVENDEAARRGSYVVVPDDVGNVYAPTDDHFDTNYVEFCVRIEQAGTYVIDAITLATDRNSDSFWVTVDGDRNPTALWHVPKTPTWSNSEVFDRSLSEPMLYQLGAGDHLVRFIQREDNTALDAIELRRVGGLDTMAQAECVEPNRFGSVPYLQAEDGAFSGTMEVGVVDRVSPPVVTTYVGSSEDAGNRYDFDPRNYVELCFTIAEGEGGFYGLVPNTFAPDNKSDSFFVQMDDGEPRILHLRISDTWQSESITSTLRRGFRYELEPGQHRLRFYQREDGALLDAVEVRAVGAPVEPTPTPEPTPPAVRCVAVEDDDTIAVANRQLVEEAACGGRGAGTITGDGTFEGRDVDWWAVGELAAGGTLTVNIESPDDRQPMGGLVFGADGQGVQGETNSVVNVVTTIPADGEYFVRAFPQQVSFDSGSGVGVYAVGDYEITVSYTPPA